MHRPRSILLAATAVALAAGLAACGSGADDGGSSPVASKNGVTSVEVAGKAGQFFDPATIEVAKDNAIAATVPAKIRESGKLQVGIGALPSAFPPLVVVGDDQRTITGSEPDFARLVAAVLGLQPQLNNSTWENLFIGISGGRNDVGISNITDTEERKQKYDFATYRHDDLAFETLKSSKLSFDGDPSVLAGLDIAVSSGTNQERILLKFKKDVEAKGKTFTIKYFPDANSSNLALTSGRIDAYFGPNPTIAYHVSQTEKTATPTKTAGSYSGAGGTLQGLIGATTVKGNGLVKPLQQAIDKLIETGAYAKWLKAYNLSNESVTASEINPPGLPLTDS